MIYAGIMVVEMNSFILSTCVTTLSTCELVVDNTLDGEDNLSEKTREVVDIRLQHFDWNSLQLSSDMIW